MIIVSLLLLKMDKKYIRKAMQRILCMLLLKDVLNSMKRKLPPIIRRLLLILYHIMKELILGKLSLQDRKIKKRKDIIQLLQQRNVSITIFSLSIKNRQLILPRPDNKLSIGRFLKKTKRTPVYNNLHIDIKNIRNPTTVNPLKTYIKLRVSINSTRLASKETIFHRIR